MTCSDNYRHVRDGMLLKGTYGVRARLDISNQLLSPYLLGGFTRNGQIVVDAGVAPPGLLTAHPTQTNPTFEDLL